jgi:hypothetical protein
VPPGAGNSNAAQPALPGLRRTPYACFRYSPDARLGIRNRNAVVPGPGGLPSPPGGQSDFVASYTTTSCFRYRLDGLAFR